MQGWELLNPTILQNTIIFSNMDDITTLLGMELELEKYMDQTDNSQF